MSEPENIPPELREWMDGEIALKNAPSAGEEGRVLSMLQSMSGVEQPSLSGGQILLRYDPLLITMKEICEGLVRAGIELADVKASASSPVVDAVQS